MSAAVRRLSEALINVLRKGVAADDIPEPTLLGGESPEKASTSTSGSMSILEGDSTVVVDDTIYEDYDPMRIRELRRSWPQTKDEAEFRYGVTLRAKEQNDLKVKALDQTFGSEAATDFHSHLSSDSLHLRQVINWEHLPEDSVAGAARSTVWNGGSALFDIEQNDKEITRIVAMFSTSKGSNKRISFVAKGSRESVLDQKRSTAISVAMKRMRLQPAKFGKLAWALRDMNEAYLTPSAIEIMVKSSLWATPKEIEDMKARIREGHELADPDALLYFLATSVPDTAARVSALAFRYEFDEVMGEMIRATSLIKAASLEVCTSELLKRLMRVVLLVGNNINESFGGTAAWGISLTSLSKLSTIKTTDKSLSVLDCVVTYLDQMAPETFEVADDCTCTPSAAKYSLSTEAKVLQDTRRGLETMRKIKSMEKFYLSASKKLNDIDREMRLAKEDFDKAMDHFCVSRGSMDTNEFFGYLAMFFDDLDRAISAHESRQRQLLHPTVRSGLLNPAFMKERRESSWSFSSASGKKDNTYAARPSAARPSIFGRMMPGKE